jgi:hypothetical protein
MSFSISEFLGFTDAEIVLSDQEMQLAAEDKSENLAVLRVQ